LLLLPSFRFLLGVDLDGELASAQIQTSSNFPLAIEMRWKLKPTSIKPFRFNF
jgi:hypothetical protein